MVSHVPFDVKDRGRHRCYCNPRTILLSSWLPGMLAGCHLENNLLVLLR
jgi:hypothetical protein